MTSFQQNTAKAGYLIGGVLGVIRMSSATTLQDFLIVAALTGAEFTVVWLLEKKTRRLETEMELWRTGELVRGQEEASTQVAADGLVNRQRVVDNTVAEQVQIEHVCEWDHLMSDFKALLAIATNSIRSGYLTGTKRNDGERGGVQDGGQAA